MLTSLSDSPSADNLKLQLRQHSRQLGQKLQLDQFANPDVQTIRDLEWYEQYCKSAYMTTQTSHLKGKDSFTNLRV